MTAEPPMMPKPPQRGLTLLELLVGLAITALLMGSLVAMLVSASAAGDDGSERRDLQTQAQFALRRMALRIRQTPNALLPPKSDDASSGTWLAPATYDLRSGTVAGTLALTETIAATGKVLAEPVSSFSITSPTVTAGRTLIAVRITLARGNSRASASLVARMGGAR